QELENTVRTYSPSETFNGRNYLSFSSLVASKADTEKYRVLAARKLKTEIINYRGNTDKFFRFDTPDIYSSNMALQLIHGKIVLMGFMGSDLKSAPVLEDIHFTPLNQVYLGRTYPDMYGVVIQANIISMILKGNFINRMKKFWLWLISFFVCYLH